MTLRSLFAKDELEAMAGWPPAHRHVSVHVAGDATTGFDPSGRVVFAYIPNALPRRACELAFSIRGHVRPGNVNRSYTAGRLLPDEVPDNAVIAGRSRLHYRRQWPDGTLGQTTYARPAASIVIGALPPTARLKDSRISSFNRHHPTEVAAMRPLVAALDSCYRAYLPAHWEVQRALMRRVPKELRTLGSAVFASLVANRNFRTCVHQDRGDAGMTAVAVLSSGAFTGGEYVLPEFGVAVGLRVGDVLLADPTDWHGNLPIVGVVGEYVRLSVVAYLPRRIVGETPVP